MAQKNGKWNGQWRRQTSEQYLGFFHVNQKNKRLDCFLSFSRRGFRLIRLSIRDGPRRIRRTRRARRPIQLGGEQCYLWYPDPGRKSNSAADASLRLIQLGHVQVRIDHGKVTDTIEQRSHKQVNFDIVAFLSVLCSVFASRLLSFLCSLFLSKSRASHVRAHP